mgnify:CR=1 FL=1
MYADNIEVVKIGSMRLFKALIDELKIVETINNNVNWDQKQWKISPGNLIAAILLSIFYGNRVLYKLDEFYEEQDLELLFGVDGLTAESFNDDCLGRALDRLAEGNPQVVFGTAVLNAKKAHGFSTSICHADTTTFQVYGEYEQEDGWDPDPFVVARGYNKQGDYELKQFKLGLATNHEGIPIFGEPLSGNMDDKTWSKTFLEYLPELEPVLKDDAILIVDSAAMTEDTLRMTREGVRLISRLPETFALCGELKREALASGAWQPVDSLDEKRNADYRVQCFERELAGGRYHFVVVESKVLALARGKTIDRAVTREGVALEKAFASLAKECFPSREAAEAVWHERLKQLAPIYHTPAYGITEAAAKPKRGRPGRPAKGENPPAERYYSISATAGAPDAAKVESAKALSGLFVLFSSAGDLAADEVLGLYKGRPYIENRFAFLKDPRFVGPVYLKLPGRIEALCYVMLLALLVYSLFERRVREGLRAEGKSYRVAGSYKTMRPSGKTLLAALEGMSIIKKYGLNGVKRLLPRNVNKKAQQIVRYCGFDIGIYVQPPNSGT